MKTYCSEDTILHQIALSSGKSLETTTMSLKPNPCCCSWVPEGRRAKAGYTELNINLSPSCKLFQREVRSASLEAQYLIPLSHHVYFIGQVSEGHTVSWPTTVMLPHQAEPTACDNSYGHEQKSVLENKSLLTLGILFGGLQPFYVIRVLVGLGAMGHGAREPLCHASRR